MARGHGVAVLGPRLGIRGLTRGMWGGNGDVKLITVLGEGGVCHDGVWQKVREFYVLLTCSQYSSTAVSRRLGEVAWWAWSRRGRCRIMGVIVLDRPSR